MDERQHPKRKKVASASQMKYDDPRSRFKLCQDYEAWDPTTGVKNRPCPRG